VVAMVAIGLPPPPVDPSAYGQAAHPDATVAKEYDAISESYQRWSARWAEGYRAESELSEQRGT